MTRLPSYAAMAISIHALLAESDKPTSGILRFDPLISIHALLAESDTYQEMQTAKLLISIHALLAESDSKSAQNSGALLHI